MRCPESPWQRELCGPRNQAVFSWGNGISLWVRAEEGACVCPVAAVTLTIHLGLENNTPSPTALEGRSHGLRPECLLQESPSWPIQVPRAAGLARLVPWRRLLPCGCAASCSRAFSLCTPHLPMQVVALRAHLGSHQNSPLSPHEGTVPGCRDWNRDSFGGRSPAHHCAWMWRTRRPAYPEAPGGPGVAGATVGPGVRTRRSRDSRERLDVYLKWAKGFEWLDQIYVFYRWVSSLCEQIGGCRGGSWGTGRGPARWGPIAIPSPLLGYWEPWWTHSLFKILWVILSPPLEIMNSFTDGCTPSVYCSGNSDIINY